MGVRSFQQMVDDHEAAAATEATLAVALSQNPATNAYRVRAAAAHMESPHLTPAQRAYWANVKAQLGQGCDLGRGYPAVPAGGHHPGQGW